MQRIFRNVFQCNVCDRLIVVTICKRLHAKIPHFAFNAASWHASAQVEC